MNKEENRGAGEGFVCQTKRVNGRCHINEVEKKGRFLQKEFWEMELGEPEEWMSPTVKGSEEGRKLKDARRRSGRQGLDNGAGNIETIKAWIKKPTCKVGRGRSDNTRSGIIKVGSDEFQVLIKSLRELFRIG